MKALTLHQPYAQAVALGAKTVETRSWPTSHRGPVAIHAGVHHLPRGVEFGRYRTARSGNAGSAVVLHQFAAPGPLLGIPTLQAVHQLPLGAVVAVATITDCVHIEAEHGDGLALWADYVAIDPEQPDNVRRWVRSADVFGAGTHAWTGTSLGDEPQAAWGDYRPGRWAWLLADVHALAEPVPCRGYQRLWGLPPDAEALVTVQLSAWPT